MSATSIRAATLALAWFTRPEIPLLRPHVGMRAGSARFVLSGHSIGGAKQEYFSTATFEHAPFSPTGLSDFFSQATIMSLLE